MSDRMFFFNESRTRAVSNVFYKMFANGDAEGCQVLRWELYSYSVRVCAVKKHRGEVTFERLYYGAMGESRTTMKHINLFREKLGLPKISVREYKRM